MGTSDGRSRQGPPSPASGRPHVDRQPLSPPAASAPRQLRRHNCRGPKGKPNAGASDGRTGHRANTRVASRRQGAGRASDNARTTASFPVMRQPSKHRGSGGCPSEQGHQCRDYVLKFSIGHATWRPLRGHLSRAAEMDDMCNRVNRERATFSPIVPIDVGLFVVYSNGVYLSIIREAPARRDPCDPPEIPLLRLVEGGDRLPRRRHDTHTRREVADRADIRQSSDTWQHRRLPPCRGTISLEPMQFEMTKDKPK